MGYRLKPKYPLFLKGINEENNVCNGYPIIIIKDNFNIKAKPDTFHDIKNNANDEINITFEYKEFYPNDITNEFIFNVRSPANISFDKEIKWDNNNLPDFEQEGLYTISILNGVGCYTFVNIDSIPNNEIWYTSSDDNIVTPIISALPEIDSNTYVDGKGVIKFKTDVTKIGREAFKDRRSLTSIIIPDSVTSIWHEAFKDCTSLTSITIPNNVTNIYNSAFKGCRSLTSINIPDSVTGIDWNVFNSCVSLTSITIPNSVTYIGIEAFQDCIGLKSVIIPNSVTYIEYAAFYNCSSLTSISYNGTASQWNAITKETDWNRNVPATTVHCDDGDVQL